LSLPRLFRSSLTHLLGRGFRHAWQLLFAIGLLALAAAPARAHEMTIAEMELQETAAGEFLWRWAAANDKRPIGDDLKPVWPAQCRADSNALHCGDGGLKGQLSIEGVGERYSAALIRITWLDGQTRAYTLTSRQAAVELYGSADDRRGQGEIAKAYTLLGVEHILGGIDHLLFVASLLFLVGFQRRLIATITAFTLAHSLTLALSVFGWVSLRSPPVEASIAMSIVLVAGEAMRERETLARRWPALVSFLFGLVHGLGFAGALRDVGLPQAHLPLALLCFNVGVELGQLLMVLLAFLLVHLPIGRRYLGYARRPALYAIGAVAAYWSWERVAAIVL
jgi:hypothetical protein